MDICEMQTCTGCFACANVCPEKCINMAEKEYGCIYPIIDEGLCIKCNMCKKICPINKPLTKNSADLAYAAWSKDDSDRVSSSSGGAASVFSQNMINNGGVVFGASIGQHFTVEHKMAITTEECKQFKGSKYVQSHINNTFLLAKDKLEDSINVLFIGLPCQIAGLLSYLQKPYDNLITCDLICHGTPPQRLLQDHVKLILNRNNLDGLTFSFRQSKSFGMSLKVFNRNKVIYDERFYNDNYYLGFMKCLFYRESCYLCKYATPNRIADITIGDFWGICKKDICEQDTNKGISAILPNTAKGHAFIKSCNNDMILFERDINEVIAGNAQLNYSYRPHPNREKFKSLYERVGFKEAVKHCLIRDKIKYKLLYFLIGIPITNKIIRIIKK